MNIVVNFRKTKGINFLLLLVVLFLVISCDDSETGDKCNGVTCSAWEICSEDTGKCILKDGNCNEKSECSGDNQCVEHKCVNPCAEINCSGHGTCEVVNNVAVCNCTTDYQQSDDKLDCVSNVCINIDCSGHGNCIEFADAPLCNCDTDYVRGDDKISCTPKPQNCDPACDSWQECNDAQECVTKDGFCKDVNDCNDNQICNTGHRCEVPSTCDPACDDSWQVCNDAQECVTKDGFCKDVNDCIGEELCNDTHKCEVPSTCNPACDDSWQVCNDTQECVPKETFCDATTDCGAGNSCDDTTHKCIATCTPLCDNKACGDDGCNGSCGDCAAGSSCNDSFECVVDDPCAGVECNNGVCEVDGNDAVCLCENAYSGDSCDVCANDYHLFEENCVKTVPMGAVIITEFMANPDVDSDAKAEWIEIYNTSDNSIDLSVLKVYKNTTKYNVTFVGNTVIASHEYMLIARSTEAVLPTYDATSPFSLTNGGADISIVLNDMVLDVVTYTASTKAKSWQLDPSFLDWELNNEAEAWCLGTTTISDTNSDLGTPGLANIACPE